ncbi:MAG: efflux RND transporter periplasmic adaptor subunit [Verrucomicrobiales bacterium]|nr:efflux RND transporter periplasmic adaptor subunit [Verrucomicrobiales bacterium]
MKTRSSVLVTRGQFVLRVHSIASLLLAGAVWLFAGAFARPTHAVEAPPTAATGQTRTLYTCGMHPQVIQDKPGNCPICGMKLTPIRRPTTGDAATPTGPATILIDPVTIQNMGIRTDFVRRGPVHRTLRTVGTIEYDETALADVTTKFRGWIEKLYVNATGQLVRRGEPLFEIYSPELYSAQVEYLLALGREPGANAAERETLLAAARRKLAFFDVAAEAIAELERTREPRRTLRVLAPRDGIVLEKDVVAGQMVEAGTRIYRLADLSLVWVQAELYEQDLPLLRTNQEAIVRLTYWPGREFHGRIAYVYPTVNPQTRTARARLELPNPDFLLKPGMFATVELLAQLEQEALLVPDTAVLRSGRRNTVFVALEGGRFEPREVTLGAHAEGDFYQVLSGLHEGERIVVSGQFMLDSESRLREAIQKMFPIGQTNGASTPAPPHTHPSASATRDAAPPSDSAPAPALFTCPMAEHADVVADKSGTCPKCEMTLVDTRRVAHGPRAEAAWRKARPPVRQDEHKH